MSNKKTVWSFIRGIFGRKMTVTILVLLLMIAVPAFASPYFLTMYNIQALLRDLAFNGILAIMMSMLLVLGDFDLSVGKMGALCGILAGLMMTSGIAPVIAILITLLAGAFFGFINGFLVTKLRLMAMIVTIGMNSVYAGINIVLTKGVAVTGLPKNWLFIGQGFVLGIPVPFLIMLLFLAAATFLMRFTRFGRYIYAVGNNRVAAKILGIRADLVRIITFAIMGLSAAAVGTLYVARLGTSQPNLGDTWPMMAIAACVIGGVSLSGGEGHPVGALIGAAIMTLITNVIVMLGISVYWQTASSGFVIILAISIEPIQKIIMEKRKVRARGKHITETADV